jgi:NitT/TauT family transport system ATP-binding protein
VFPHVRQQKAIASQMLNIAGATKYFSTSKGQVTAFEGVSFSVAEGEFVSVVGPSGCGKSTLLSVVSGLASPDRGQVSLGGEAILGVDRRVGYTFQQSTLLPWRTVKENVGLGLELRGISAEQKTARVAQIVEQVGLTQFIDAYPHQLSGGMAKRAEIARVLAIDPEILLMDEPFGALDAQTKISMQDHLLHLLQNLRKTVLFITHDLEEAVILSDRVITMSARPGRIKGNHLVPLDRPRSARSARLDPRFAGILKTIWDDIDPQADSHG